MILANEWMVDKRVKVGSDCAQGTRGITANEISSKYEDTRRRCSDVNNDSLNAR
jgi:hypothetical protein